MWLWDSDRNLPFALVRANEASVIRDSPLSGHGDKEGADGADVDPMCASCHRGLKFRWE